MTELEVLEKNIHELKGWLNAAWRQLASASPTKFERGELRHEMKRCSAELQRCLETINAERARTRSRSRHPGKPNSGSQVLDFRFIGRDTSSLGKS